MTDKNNNPAIILPSEDEVEIWLPAPGFEDRYEVSSFGRLRSKKTQLLRKLQQDHNGYPCVTLRRRDHPTDDRMKIHFVYIHRLVCEAFNGPPTTEANICDHKDRCMVNNYYGNLHWTTPSDNRRNSKKITARKITTDTTPIILFDLDGNYVERFNSIIEAHKKMDVSILQIRQNVYGYRRPFGFGYFRAETELP